jgi:putative DNA primase/helicase
VTAEPENCTEWGNARRLVRRHGPRIHYVFPWGAWLVFRDGRWVKDVTGELERLAKETVRAIYAEADAAASDAERQRLAAWAVKSERATQMLHAMLELARSEPGVPVTPDQLDADPWLLNVANGTLDLRTGALRPHNPGDLITKLAPVAFDSAADCPRWLTFLARVFDGWPDVMAFVQRAVGYALTGCTTEQVLFFLYGLGANGKTTLIEVLRALLGDYAMQASFATFAERRGDGPRNDLARLAGARLVAASEVGEGARFDEELVKQLTGNDAVTARFLYGEHFEFRPAFKLVLAANHKPVVRGTDCAIWRRIHLIPFTETIPEDERDPHLLGKLTAELPGILRWALDGCLAWQRDGLGAPVAVRSATLRYREEMDTIGAFLDETCRLDASGRVRAAVLYSRYKEWCERAGERALSQRKLGERLAERGLHRITSNGTIWLGLELLPDGTQTEPSTEARAPLHKLSRTHAQEEFVYGTSKGSVPSVPGVSA